jgi:hypothetical protein
MPDMVTEHTFWPDGCDPDDVNARDFATKVQYRGMGRFAITRRGGFEQLSRAGNWKWDVRKFQRRQYRFTFEEAMDWARREQNTATVNGMTWPQVQVWLAARRAEREAQP